VLWAFAVLRTQVGFDDCLPGFPGWRLFRGVDQGLGDFAKAFAERFHQQLIFASEMFVKASVSQACVAHHGSDRRAIQAFGANPLRGLFHDPLVDFRFMLPSITHNNRMLLIIPRCNLDGFPQIDEEIRIYRIIRIILCVVKPVRSFGKPL
jgi:hypothetical protein